jgi:hypothetical protein
MSFINAAANDTATLEAGGLATGAVNMTGANVFFIQISFGSVTAVPSAVEDSVGNVYTQDPDSPLALTDDTKFVYRCLNGTGSSAMTATVESATTGITASISFSGWNNSGTIRNQTPFTSTAYDEPHAGATVDAGAGDDVIALCFTKYGGGADTWTAGGGLAFAAASVDDSNNGPIGCEYLADVSAGDYTGAWTSSIFIQAAQIIYAMEAGAPTGGVPVAWLA